MTEVCYFLGDFLLSLFLFIRLLSLVSARLYYTT